MPAREEKRLYGRLAPVGPIMICLTVHELSVNFGGLRAVDRVSYGIEAGTIHGLIGPNGAGKTTVFNCITGFYRPTRGTIRLNHDGGKEIALERLNDFRISRQAK